MDKILKSEEPTVRCKRLLNCALVTSVFYILFRNVHYRFQKRPTQPLVAPSLSTLRHCRFQHSVIWYVCSIVPTHDSTPRRFKPENQN
jgi:hypothetical protein